MDGFYNGRSLLHYSTTEHYVALFATESTGESEQECFEFGWSTTAIVSSGVPRPLFPIHR
jgi:hypothetical protein